MKAACFLPLSSQGSSSSAIRHLHGQFFLLQAALCHRFHWTWSQVIASATAAGRRDYLLISCPVKISFSHWLMQFWYLKYHHANPEECPLHSYKSSHKNMNSLVRSYGRSFLALLACTAELSSAGLPAKAARSRAHIILLNHIIALALQCLKVICLN